MDEHYEKDLAMIRNGNADPATAVVALEQHSQYDATEVDDRFIVYKRKDGSEDIVFDADPEIAEAGERRFHVLQDNDIPYDAITGQTNNPIHVTAKYRLEEDSFTQYRNKLETFLHGWDKEDDHVDRYAGFEDMDTGFYITLDDEVVWFTTFRPEDAPELPHELLAPLEPHEYEITDLKQGDSLRIDHDSKRLSKDLQELDEEHRHELSQYSQKESVEEPT